MTKKKKESGLTMKCIECKHKFTLPFSAAVDLDMSPPCPKCYGFTIADSAKVTS